MTSDGEPWAPQTRAPPPPRPARWSLSARRGAGVVERSAEGEAVAENPAAAEVAAAAARAARALRTGRAENRRPALAHDELAEAVVAHPGLHHGLVPARGSGARDDPLELPRESD